MMLEYNDKAILHTIVLRSTTVYNRDSNISDDISPNHLLEFINKNPRIWKLYLDGWYLDRYGASSLYATETMIKNSSTETLLKYNGGGIQYLIAEELKKRWEDNISISIIDCEQLVKERDDPEIAKLFYDTISKNLEEMPEWWKDVKTLVVNNHLLTNDKMVRNVCAVIEEASPYDIARIAKVISLPKTHPIFVAFVKRYLEVGAE